MGKESSTTSNISFVISGESSDSGIRKLTDGKIKVSFYLIFVSNACTSVVVVLLLNLIVLDFLYKYSTNSNRLNTLRPNYLNNLNKN